MSPSTDRLKALQVLPRHRTTNQCRGFCGKIIGFMHCLPKLNQILSPLFQLTSGTRKFYWREEEENTYLNVIKLLFKAQTLHLPDYGKPIFCVHDSAKSHGGSGCIMQRDSRGDLQPLLHMSLSYKGAMKMYSQFKGEIFMLVYIIKANISLFKWQKSFSITDVSALQYLIKYSEATEQMYSWSVLLQSLNMYIIPCSAQHSPAICFWQLLTIFSVLPHSWLLPTLVLLVFFQND